MTESSFPIFRTQMSGNENETVIDVFGELDLSSSDQFLSAVEEAIAQCSRVIVNLAEASFIDSSGLSVLVRAQQWLDISGGALILRSPRGQALMAIRAAGLEKVLRIES